jgi:hypothetical protein
MPRRSCLPKRLRQSCDTLICDVVTLCFRKPFRLSGSHPSLELQLGCPGGAALDDRLADAQGNFFRLLPARHNDGENWGYSPWALATNLRIFSWDVRLVPPSFGSPSRSPALPSGVVECTGPDTL